MIGTLARRRRRGLAPASRSAVAALAVIIALGAAAPTPAITPLPGADGGVTVLKYAGCALSIASAPTGLGLVAAIVSCAVLLFEPNPPAGEGQ